MQVLKEDIRSRILKVARQQFAQKGYAKTSMREIAGLAIPWKPCCKSTTAYGARTL